MTVKKKPVIWIMCMTCKSCIFWTLYLDFLRIIFRLGLRKFRSCVFSYKKVDVIVMVSRMDPG